MFNNFVELIKRNKGILLIFGGILLFVLAFFLDLRTATERITTVQNPVVTTPTEPILERNINVVSVSPENGNVTTIDSFQSVFIRFNKPVDIDTLQYTVVPGIALSALVVDDTTIEFIPGAGSAGWDAYVGYTIKITDIEAKDGTSRFNGPYVYEYKNIPPDTTKMVFPY